MPFVRALEKTAVMDLADQSLNEALAPMQTAVPGTSLRANASTAQGRGRATRTFNVQNEDKEFAKQFKMNWKNSRLP